MKQSNGINMLALVLLGLGLSYAVVTSDWDGDAEPRRAGGFGSNTWNHTSLRITNSGSGEYWEIERPDRPMATGRWRNPNDTPMRLLTGGNASNVTEISIVCTNCWATNQFRLLP